MTGCSCATAFSGRRCLTPAFMAPMAASTAALTTAVLEGSGPSRNQSPGLNYTHIFESDAGDGVSLRHCAEPQSGDQCRQRLDDLPKTSVSPASIWTRGRVALPKSTLMDYTTPMLGFSASLPWVRSVTNFNIVNNWTKTMGTHIFKWGVDIRRERQDLLQTQTFNPRGLVHFHRWTHFI